MVSPGFACLPATTTADEGARIAIWWIDISIVGALNVCQCAAGNRASCPTARRNRSRDTAIWDITLDMSAARLLDTDRATMAYRSCAECPPGQCPPGRTSVTMVWTVGDADWISLTQALRDSLGSREASVRKLLPHTAGY